MFFSFLKRNISEPCNGRATNNCGEIQAAIKAVQVLKRHGALKIYIEILSIGTILFILLVYFVPFR